MRNLEIVGSVSDGNDLAEGHSLGLGDRPQNRCLAASRIRIPQANSAEAIAYGADGGDPRRALFPKLGS